MPIQKWFIGLSRSAKSFLDAGEIRPLSALAVPTASEASAMEAPETAAHMAETSDVGDTHAVSETATSKMGDIYAAVSETVISKMRRHRCVDILQGWP